MKTLVAGLITCLAATATPAGVKPLDRRCVNYTSQHFGVPTALLDAVHEIEAGYPGAINRNRNGTIDMGPMQHNSRTAGDLQRKYGVNPTDLMWNECVAVWVTGWELATSAIKHRDWRLAIAAYNAGDGAVARAVRSYGGIPHDIADLPIPAKTRDQYVPRVMRAWARLSGR